MLPLVDPYHVLQVIPRRGRRGHPGRVPGPGAQVSPRHGRRPGADGDPQRRLGDRGRPGAARSIRQRVQAAAAETAATDPHGASGDASQATPLSHATPFSHATASGPATPSSPARPSSRRSTSPGAGSGTVLDFGRYAGFSIGELAAADPDYLEWLARTTFGRRLQSEIETVLAAARRTFNRQDRPKSRFARQR